MREIKLKGLPAVIVVIGATLVAAAVGLALSRFLLEVPKQPANVDRLTRASIDPSPIPDKAPKSLPVSPNGVALAQEEVVGTTADAAAIAARQGLLRVGNPTEHPVRVALLLKKAKLAKDKTTQSAYEPPAHWDFDPGEGSGKGLLLSLPNRKLKLKPGDILVAFAQDGSRRYWGPYVVGETSTPVWSPKLGEWELILEP